MPVSMSTQFTAWASLPLDLDIPEASRTRFEVKFLTIMQTRELTAAIDGVPGQSWEQWRQRLNVAITKVLVGVCNAPSSGVTGAEVVDLTDPEGVRKVKVTPLLDEMLSDLELRDLGVEIIQATRLGYDELKKSKLQQRSAGG